MCLAEMLIKGQNAENICYQDTMKADRFKGTKMRFVLENPPFGTAWGGKDAAEGVEDAVNTEYQKGFDGRWGAGLPGSGDMQMLFLQSAIDKMDDNFGRAAIIENGSPLFSGGTASGESQIRRWMLESDLIDRGYRQHRRKYTAVPVRCHFKLRFGDVPQGHHQRACGAL